MREKLSLLAACDISIARATWSTNSVSLLNGDRVVIVFVGGDGGRGQGGKTGSNHLRRTAHVTLAGKRSVLRIGTRLLLYNTLQNWLARRIFTDRL